MIFYILGERDGEREAVEEAEHQECSISWMNVDELEVEVFLVSGLVKNRFAFYKAHNIKFSFSNEGLVVAYSCNNNNNSMNARECALRNIHIVLWKSFALPTESVGKKIEKLHITCI
ncbi:hypothetical protein T10_2231 [Trichinella papuae]|uniref:Uncharacterized protein n=1 Tax=Trichinella papuae TaxID=268474 RepID=A0A0V1MMC3_9BILA|nr:hypothetical protein T10_2231 [Trichinella papuae]